MAKKLFPFKRNGRFYFDKDHKPESFLFDTIPSSIRSFIKRPFNIPTDPTIWVDQHAINNCQIEPSVTWLGHSSFLIQMHGVNIITDPIFDQPSWIYPRMLPLGIAPDNLPPVHAVLISHNHRDHMDEKSLLYIKKISNNQAQMLVPMGDKSWFDKRGFAHVHEFEWEQEHAVSNHDQSGAVACTFVPAHHWSQRGLLDKNKSLWGGWVIHVGQQQIYFAGDTAYRPECFARIKHIFPTIGLALIPIGPGEPRSWMRHSHVDADEAGETFLDVGAQHMIPMHWGTFSFGNDHFDEPVNKLRQWWFSNQHRLGSKQLSVLKIGQRFDLPVSSIDQVAEVNMAADVSEPQL